MFIVFTDLDQFSKGQRTDLFVNVTEGDAVVLTCLPPSGVPDPTIYWTVGRDESNPLPIPVNISSDRINTDDATGDLIFANVFPDDTDDYKCNADNSGLNILDSEPIHLEVNKGKARGPQNRNRKISWKRELKPIHVGL